MDSIDTSIDTFANIENCFKRKVVQNLIPYKKLSAGISLSPPGEEIGVPNIFGFWNDALD